MSSIPPDWLSRVVLPDLYPRKEDPYRPGAGSIPTGSPAASYDGDPVPTDIGGLLSQYITTPGQRPTVVQRSMTFTITAGVNAVPFVKGGNFYCDSMVVDVFSTAANSVFIAENSAVTVNTGLEVRAGLPILLEPHNTREQWELQRLLEFQAAIMAMQAGVPPLPPFMSPRVVFDASTWFAVATANTTVVITLFLTPQFQ